MQQKQPQLRAEKMSLFPSMDSLDEALTYYSTKLPIKDENILKTVLLTYHNTLLNTIQAKKPVN